MRVAKYPLAVAMSLVLSVMLLCSQICDFNCSLYGCSALSPTKTSESANAHARCHQQNENTKPQEHRDSQQCAGHFDATALLSSSQNSVYTPSPISFALALIPEPLPLFNSSQRLALQCL